MSVVEERKQYEPLAEWRIRRISPPSREPEADYPQRLRKWTLDSIGISAEAQEAYIKLEEQKMATAEDIGGETNLDATRRALDELYTAGVVDRLGRAFYIKQPLSACIVNKLIPRVAESLREVASIESKTRTSADAVRMMRGQSYDCVAKAASACRMIQRMGGSPSARVSGVFSITGDAVELEGPVLENGFDKRHLIVYTENGGRVVVGDPNDPGVDVYAHSILVRGERGE